MGISIWSFCILFALFSNNPSIIYFWEQFKYLGILIIPPSWFLLIASWIGKTSLLKKKIILGLYGSLLVVLPFVFTNQYHHLIWTSITYDSYQSYLLTNTSHGLVWWIFTIYAYILIFLGIHLLISNFFSLKKVYKYQSIILCTGASIPLLLNIIYSIGLSGPYFDYTPVGFLITCMVFTLAFTKFSILELVPIARTSVFDNLHDPIFMFDTKNCLVEFNNTAKHLLLGNPIKNLGKNLNTVFQSFPEIIENFHLKNYNFEVMFKSNDKIQFYDVVIKPLKENKRILGNIFLFREITDRKLAEEQLQAIYSSSPISICLNEFETGRFVDINKSFIEKTGYSRKELIGKTPLERGIWNEPADWQSKRFITLLKENGFVENESFIFKNKNGNKIHGLISSSILMFKDKKYILSNIIDTTRQKESEENAKKQLIAITSSMDGIAILNDQQEYVFVNDAHAHIYGYEKPDELVGKTWRILYNDDELERFDNIIMPEFFRNRWWRGEAIGKKKDGMVFSQEVTLTMLDEGGLVCIVRDITKNKMVLRELEDAHQVLFTINKDLERKVKQRTEAIEQLIKQKDDFINQLGHDLKTPLTPLMILLPMLEKKVSSQKDKELFNIVTRNVAFMKELVNKTINLAKLNSNKIPFNIESVSLAEEIKNSISINKVMFEENNITVENTVTDEIIVEADQIQLQELLNNLITNAVKYSPQEGGIIYIDSTTDDELADVIVSIRDTGIGMDDEQVRYVFNEFYKADDSRHNLDSSGLGLNICKRIVEKHGGKIWVESPGKNQGSTFYFTIKKSKTE
jgi:PAS domain S-box-containing protein